MFRHNIAALAAITILIAPDCIAAPAAKSNPARGKAIDLISEGQSLERSGDNKGAFGKYLESAKVAPSPLAYYHLGRISRISGDGDNARRYLQQALDLNPKYEMAKLEMQQIRKGGPKSDQVKAVAETLPGSLEPGGAIEQAQGSINVDGLRREYVTMQSLEKPVIAN